MRTTLIALFLLFVLPTVSKAEEEKKLVVDGPIANDIVANGKIEHMDCRRPAVGIHRCTLMVIHRITDSDRTRLWECEWYHDDTWPDVHITCYAPGFKDED